MSWHHSYRLVRDTEGSEATGSNVGNRLVVGRIRSTPPHRSSGSENFLRTSSFRFFDRRHNRVVVHPSFDHQYFATDGLRKREKRVDSEQSYRGGRTCT